MNKKLILAIVVLVILGAGLIKYKEYRIQEANKIVTYTIKPTYTNTPSVTPDMTSPDSVVQAYYNWYDICINRNFENSSDSQDEDCSYDGLLTESLNQRDHPTFCAANTPAKITYEKAKITGNYATAIVHTHWGASPRGNINVELEKQNNVWKMSNITCPRP